MKSALFECFVSIMKLRERDEIHGKVTFIAKTAIFG